MAVLEIGVAFGVLWPTAIIYYFSASILCWRLYRKNKEHNGDENLLSKSIYY